MYKIKSLPEFTEWLDSLNDNLLKGVILARLKRVALGLKGDVKSVGDGVYELRIHMGAGWRVYFTERNGELIVLLYGGNKRTQAKDIKKAKELAFQIE